MSVITKGKTFANGEQLTAGKLNQMLDAAVFSSAAVDNTKTTLSGGAITIAPNAITSTEIAQSFLDTIYPIGSIYTNATNSTNPGTLLGFGTWVSFGAGRVPVGIDSSDTDFDTAEETGGVKEVTLTAAQSGLPSHSHTQLGGGFDGNVGIEPGNNRNSNLGQTGTTGGTDASSAHTNLQPYIVVYMWKRTA
jgi:hypothetical protein